MEPEFWGIGKTAGIVRFRPPAIGALSCRRNLSGPRPLPFSLTTCALCHTCVAPGVGQLINASGGLIILAPKGPRVSPQLSGAPSYFPSNEVPQQTLALPQG